jgi:hypothetical protein
MPAAEFVKEAWKLALYALLVFIFILNLLYSWSNYHSALGYADDLREARMNAVALLNTWSEDGVISSSRATSEDLPENTMVRLYRADGTLIKELNQSPVEGKSKVRIKVPVVIDGQEGYMVYEERI